MITLGVGDSWLLTWNNPRLPDDVAGQYFPLRWIPQDEYGEDVLGLGPLLARWDTRALIVGRNPGFGRIRCETATGFGTQWSDYFEIRSKPTEFTLPCNDYEWLREWRPSGAQRDPAYRSRPLYRFTDIRGI